MIDLSKLLFGFNLVDFIFVHFIVLMVVFGVLMNSVEQYLPAALRQSIRYGKFAYSGQTDKLVSLLEVPKSWFKHFYVFAAVYASLSAYLVFSVYFQGSEAPQVVVAFLDLVYGPERTVKISSTTAALATGLMTFQCLRRFYETQFVQIFSKASKINLSHYIVGYLHYFGTLTAILGAAEGFVGQDRASPSFEKISLADLTFSWLFLYAWFYQFQSNLILAGMRKNKSGKVVTEKHLLPRGGYFELVSSPHMLFEVLMYVALCGLLRGNRTGVYIMVWVVVNQVHNALMTHRWYKETFKEYPKTRRAILPYLL